MIKNYLIILFFCGFKFIFSQQYPSTTHLNFNQFFINPSYIGASETTNLILSSNSKWKDIDGAPQTRFFGAFTPYKKGISFGVSFLNDIVGPTNTNAFFASSSYTVSFGNNSTLSLVIRLGFSQYGGNLSSLNINDPGDPVFSTDILNEYVPNMGFGLYYNYFDNYFFGFSIPYLVNNSYYQGQEERTYFLSAGKSFKFFPDHIVKTAILVSATNAAKLKWEYNISYFSEFPLGGGVNYSLNESISPILYLKVSEILTLGYSYSVPIQEAINITDNVHEIILKINFTD